LPVVIPSIIFVLPGTKYHITPLQF